MNSASLSPRIFLSIVMPAYNEESIIEKVIAEHVSVASRFPPSVYDWEIVCVDDASVDATPRLLAALAKRITKLRVLTHPRNRGIFASLAELYQAAKGSHIYLTGSDGQWPAENMLPMLAECEAGADFVVGVRTNRRDLYDFKRRVVSYMFNLLPKALFGVDTGDAGSVKLGRREIFQLAVASRSAFAEAERIVKARRLNYRIALVPIRFSRRHGGMATGASFRNVANAVRDCFKLRFHGLGVAANTSSHR